MQMRQVGSGRRNGLEEGEAAEDRMKPGGNAGEGTGGNRGGEQGVSSPPRFRTVVWIPSSHLTCGASVSAPPLEGFLFSCDVRSRNI